MRCWFAGILFLITWVSAAAQVSGVVIDAESNNPIGGVMVKAVVDGKTKAFATTNSEGQFQIPKAPLPCKLTFRHLSYEHHEVEATNSHRVTYRLQPSNQQLEDVVVEAPRIVQRGDTTIYHMGRFVSKRDVTVQDALKKLPGVEVSQRGNISYLGKAIDKLTIDGMDLLGRDYQSTIQNLKHEKIARVEIMENQQDVKMLKDLVGDDKIVINLILNRKARGRANGKVEVGAGIDSRKEAAYRGLGHLLYVQPRWQTTVEGRVEKDFNATDEERTTFFAPLMPASALISSLPVGLSAPVPSISPHFYLRQKGGQGQLKSIYQLATNRTIHADFSYSDYTSRHTYGNELTFLTPAGSNHVRLNENRVDSHAREKNARGAIQYKQDGAINYLKEELNYVGHNTYQVDELHRTQHPLTQEVEQRSHLILNNLHWSHRIDERVLSLTNKLSYQTSPLLSLTTPDIRQGLREEIIQASLSTSFHFPLKGLWRLGLPIQTEYTSDVIYQEASEWIRGERLDFTLSPRLWRFSQGENNFSISFPATLALLKYGATPRATHLLLSPNINYQYRFDRIWSMFGQLSYKQNIGTMLDLLRLPFYTTYRQERLGSGELRKTKSGAAMVSFNFRNPIQEIYGNIQLAGNIHYSDHLLADNPSEQFNRLEWAQGDNTSGDYSAQAYISRFIRKSKSKVSMGIRTQYAHYQTIRQEVKQKSRILGVGIWGTLLFNLSEQWSGKYHFSAHRSQMWYANQQLAPLHSLSHELEVTYAPAEYLFLSLIGEHQGKELSAKEMKHLFLLSAVGEYRSHIGHFGLHLHNLLNMQEYGFTNYSASESNRSWYQLRGRSALLSYTYYF